MEECVALIQQGANVNSTDLVGNTPLHFAAMEGHLRLVEVFLSINAQVNAVTTFGNIPLHYAAGGGHKEVVTLLLGKGANKEAKNEVCLSFYLTITTTTANINTQDNRTPSDWATQHGHVEVATMLS